MLTSCVFCVTWWGPWVSILILFLHTAFDAGVPHLHFKREFLLLLFRPRVTGRVPLIWNILICLRSEEGLWGLRWGIVFYLSIERPSTLPPPKSSFRLGPNMSISHLRGTNFRVYFLFHTGAAAMGGRDGCLFNCTDVYSCLCVYDVLRLVLCVIYICLHEY